MSARIIKIKAKERRERELNLQDPSSVNSKAITTTTSLAK